MADKSYLDDYKTYEEKAGALINNLYDLIAFKGLNAKDLDKELFGRQYLQPCKHFKIIEFGRLLKYCDYLGVSLNKLMTFSYKNIVKKANIDAKEAKIKELRSELAKLEMQVKLDKQDLNEAYRIANIKEGK